MVLKRSYSSQASVAIGHRPAGGHEGGDDAAPSARGLGVLGFRLRGTVRTSGHEPSVAGPLGTHGCYLHLAAQVCRRTRLSRLVAPLLVASTPPQECAFVGLLVAKKRLFQAGLSTAPGGGTVFYVTENSHLYQEDVEYREVQTFLLAHWG